MVKHTYWYFSACSWFLLLFTLLYILLHFPTPSSFLYPSSPPILTCSLLIPLTSISIPTVFPFNSNPISPFLRFFTHRPILRMAPIHFRSFHRPFHLSVPSFHLSISFSFHLSIHFTFYSFHSNSIISQLKAFSRNRFSYLVAGTLLALFVWVIFAVSTIWLVLTWSP